MIHESPQLFIMFYQILGQFLGTEPLFDLWTLFLSNVNTPKSKIVYLLTQTK